MAKLSQRKKREIIVYTQEILFRFFVTGVKLQKEVLLSDSPFLKQQIFYIKHKEISIYDNCGLFAWLFN